MGTPIDPDLLARPVGGRNLAGATFDQVLGSGVTLLVFLRHLG